MKKPTCSFLIRLSFIAALTGAAGAHAADPLRIRVPVGLPGAKGGWGYAREYVDGMWRMLQASEPDTYVLATNRTETVRQFATMAFAAAGLEIAWKGEGEGERGISVKDGRELVRVDKRYYRPAEVDLLIGNPAKAEEKLGWRPRTSLEELCAMMVDADIHRLEGAVSPRRHIEHVKPVLKNGGAQRAVNGFPLHVGA